MKKILLFLVAVFMTVALNAQTEKDLKIWEPVMEAIATIESRKTANAVSKSGTYVGYLQIASILVKECNNIVGYQKYTLKDRYSIQKSKEMFVIIQSKYNKSYNIEKAIRIWNGGPQGHKMKSTLGYYNKVMKKFDITAFNV